MRAIFWGTRGSSPVSLSATRVRAKVKAALEAALSAGLTAPADVSAFMDKSLPFSVRGTFGGATSCVEIETGGRDCIVCDAGTGLRDLGQSLARTNALTARRYHVFLSHLHWDHIQGLPFFEPLYAPGAEVVMYGAHSALAEAVRAQQAPPFFPVAFQELKAEVRFETLEPGQAYDVAGLRVTVAALAHPGGSFGYRFEQDGKSLVYATDCENASWDEGEEHELLGFFAGADLLIFDAQYPFAATLTAKAGWGHSSNIVGVEMAKIAGVKRLCLFHHEPTLDDEALWDYCQETARYAAYYRPESVLETLMAYDGLEIAL